MSDVTTAIKQGLESAMKIFQGDLRTELKAQGHYLTGKLHDSIQYEIKEFGDVVTANIECEDYGLVMEFGVQASNIPFSSPSGRGGTSKYIQGLITFFERRGLAGKEAVRAAFATAMTHKREGMPTRGSFQFSGNGERIGFASKTFERDLDIIRQTLETVTGAKLLVQISGTVLVQPVTIYT